MTGVQTCALPISPRHCLARPRGRPRAQGAAPRHLLRTRGRNQAGTLGSERIVCFFFLRPPAPPRQIRRRSSTSSKNDSTNELPVSSPSDFISVPSHLRHGRELKLLPFGAAVPPSSLPPFHSAFQFYNRTRNRTVPLQFSHPNRTRGWNRSIPVEWNGSIPFLPIPQPNTP